MAMGKRKRHPKQASMWAATQDLPRRAAHPTYTRLNQILDEHDFDQYVEDYASDLLTRAPGYLPRITKRSLGPQLHLQPITH